MIAENLLQIQYKSPNELVEYARNPRQNEAVVDKMCSAIREFGFRIPIVAQSDGSVVDGHLRLKAARKLGLEKVPVVFADDLSEAQVKAFRLLANQSANWASWDEDLLKLEFEDLQNMDFDLELTGFDLDQIYKDFLKTEKSAEEEIPEIDEKTDPITKHGDLWILGEHRVLCGDSTDPNSYKTLLNNEVADLTITDPPYNVNYDQDGERILNDNLGIEFPEFLGKICSNILANTNGAIYIFMAISEIGNLKREFGKAGGHWSTFIIWAKNHFALSRSDYQRQYEPILYGWGQGPCQKEGSTRYWCGDRDQSDLWTEQIVGSNKLHPTMKPVALLERMILNSSKPGDTVMDPFGGSGSTLIAAENLGRKARLIELDPKYVDVIVKRWENHTGKEAVRCQS
jgi:DNA modification methylase